MPAKRRGLGLGTCSVRTGFKSRLRRSTIRDDDGMWRNASGVTDYYLFYATGNLLGLKKMKEAMWKVDQSGEFTFSDATDPNQMVLFEGEPRYDHLRQRILSQFAGREVTVGDLEEFVLAETAFRERHYKQQVLKPLELANPPKLQVLNAPPGRKRGTYALPSLRLKFARLG